MCRTTISSTCFLNATGGVSGMEWGETLTIRSMKLGTGPSLGDPFYEAMLQQHQDRVCFYKLTYMKVKALAKVKGMYYEFVVNNNGY